MGVRLREMWAEKKRRITRSQLSEQVIHNGVDIALKSCVCVCVCQEPMDAKDGQGKEDGGQLG